MGKVIDLVSYFAIEELMKIAWTITSVNKLVVTDVCFVWSENYSHTSEQSISFRTSSTSGKVPIENASLIRKMCAEDKLRMYGPKPTKIYLVVLPSVQKSMSKNGLKEFTSSWDGTTEIDGVPCFKYEYLTLFRLIKKIMKG